MTAVAELQAASSQALLASIITVTHRIADSDHQRKQCLAAGYEEMAREAGEKIQDLRAMRADLSAELLSRTPRED